MLEDEHTAHRPPLDLDPLQAAEHAPLSLGQLYPQGDILAVIHDQAEAELALLALQDAGVPEDDIDLVDGAWFARAVREIGHHRNPLQRVLAFLAAEEGEVTRQYLEEADAGHTIVVVHAGQPGVAARVVRVLTRHGAHLMRHYGRLVITDL